MATRAAVLICLAAAACGGGPGGLQPDGGQPVPDGGGDGGVVVIGDDLSDQPLAGATSEQLARFRAGDAVFGTVFTQADGLGPVYIRQTCTSCHDAAGKGPGLVQKMAVVLSDGVTPASDQSALQWGNTVRPYVAGGGQAALLPPDGGLPAGTQLALSVRIGPALFGRGYLEAVDDASILAAQAAQSARTDGIRGRVNRVTYRSQPNPDERYHRFKPGDANLIGRFGLKARQPALDDFAADAFQGDMGLTSALRPVELPNPDAKADDWKDGSDVPAGTINTVADYMRLIEIPQRRPAAARATALFAELRCEVCHVPSLRTRADYPIAQLAGIDAPVYTDLLLHDMGPELADGVTDESALSTEWRTAPLIGLRFQRTFLHDGRAKSLDEAVRMHAGQAAASARDYAALGEDDRKALLDFLGSL